MTSVPPAPTFLHGPTDGYAAAAVIDNVKPYFGTRPRAELHLDLIAAIEAAAALRDLP